MLIDEGYVTAVHDVSDGGILVAVTEMALAGNIGARLMVEAFEDKVDQEKVRHAWSLFGETQGRYIVTEALDHDIVGKLGREMGIGTCFLGWTGGDTIYLGNSDVATAGEVPLADLRNAHEGFFPALMQGEL
jgi:phosphoribosylformylglycinamidine synthase